MTRTASHAPRGIDSRIRTMLQLRDYQPTTAAAKCGIPLAAFLDLLSGKTEPGIIALCRLANGLGCSTAWLKLGAQK